MNLEITRKMIDDFYNCFETGYDFEYFLKKFLEDLGFKSSNDRLYINLFKALGLLDESGSPTERYYRFLDQGIYKEVLAEGIREAYEDLFNININAQSLSTDEVKNKLRTLTQGQKTEKVISLMAMTFSALCSIADWNEKENKTKIVEIQTKEEVKSQEPKPVEEKIISNSKKEKLELHYDIQIHLPETRDESVYDAIFSSMKKHLF